MNLSQGYGKSLIMSRHLEKFNDIKTYNSSLHQLTFFEKACDVKILLTKRNN